MKEIVITGAELEQMVSEHCQLIAWDSFRVFSQGVELGPDDIELVIYQDEDSERLNSTIFVTDFVKDVDKVNGDFEQALLRRLL